METCGRKTANTTKFRVCPLHYEDSYTLLLVSDIMTVFRLDWVAQPFPACQLLYSFF